MAFYPCNNKHYENSVTKFGPYTSTQTISIGTMDSPTLILSYDSVDSAYASFTESGYNTKQLKTTFSAGSVSYDKTTGNVTISVGVSTATFVGPGVAKTQTKSQAVPTTLYVAP